MLMNLTPNQAKVLSALDSWGSNDVVDLQGEINIPVTEIRRALTALKKKSFVVMEQYSDKRVDNYKRVVELKFPNKLDKVKIELPKIIHSTLKYEWIDPVFNIKDLEKLLGAIVPGTRVVNTEEVYYPYYKLAIVGRAGPRTLLLDAVTGAHDKELTKCLQFQK